MIILKNKTKIKFIQIKITKNKIRLEDIEKELKDIQDQKEKALNKKELTTEQNNIIKEQDTYMANLRKKTEQTENELNGLKGKLGKTIMISMDDLKKNKNVIVISVDSSIKFSKRYIRYLVKKYLKKEGIAKYLTLSATSPGAYAVKVIKKNEA